MKLPRENIYLCEYGCHTVTVDVDEGVTPMFIKCRRKPTSDRPIATKFLDSFGECRGTARSLMYPKMPRPPGVEAPTHEWYRPRDYKGLSKGEIDHVKKGGLLLRERTDAEPVYHPEW